MKTFKKRDFSSHKKYDKKMRSEGPIFEQYLNYISPFLRYHKIQAISQLIQFGKTSERYNVIFQFEQNSLTPTSKVCLIHNEPLSEYHPISLSS